MAYFSNGAEGEILGEQCLQCPVSNDAPCPILWVQTHYNYSQFENGEKNILGRAMNCLVDETGACKMKPIIENQLVNKKQSHFFDH